MTDLALHDLIELIEALEQPEPWAEGDNIPWHDPEFSRRMLIEHLDQNHDRASRRFYIVDRHVAWLHKYVLKEHMARILDLGCGPGLYCHRLAALGHTCVGIDYSPASIQFACTEADQKQFACRFVEGDLRTIGYKDDSEREYDLTILLYGELNVFRPQHTHAILQKAWNVLHARGKLVIEAHTVAAVKRIGEQAPTWYVSEAGLFGEQPHACLTQSFWSEAHQAATIRYYIIDLATGSLTRYAQSLQAYSEHDYQILLKQCGFESVETLPALSDNPQDLNPDFLVLVAEKSPTN